MVDPSFAPFTLFLPGLAAAAGLPEDVAFSCGLAGALEIAGKADVEAEIDWLSSQPEDSPVSGKSLDGLVEGLDMEV